MSVFSATVVVSFLISIFCALVQSLSYEPFVKTSSGRVLGKTYETPSGKKADVFLGVPYAQPPVDERRLKLPERMNKSTTIYDATETRPPCIQFWYKDSHSMYEESERLKQSEDCLFNNIFVPHQDSYQSPKELYPVLVWIHGGFFSSGSANEYFLNGTIDNFVSRGMIFVAINFRVGLLGYMNAIYDKIYGNYGLADQIMAIDWIYENIEEFGGNKSLITLGGHGSGAVSAHLIGLSHCCDKKLNNIIALSGNALAPWAVRVSNTLHNSQIVIREMCSDDLNVLRCLRNKNIQHIIDEWFVLVDREDSKFRDHESNELNVSGIAFTKSYFTPVVDSYGRSECILCLEADTLLKNFSDKPMIFGVTSLELNFLTDLFRKLEKNNHNFTDMSFFLPSQVFENPSEVREYVLKKYSTDYGFQSSNALHMALQIGSDQLFTAPAVSAALIQSKKTKMFLYSFNMTKKELFNTFDWYRCKDCLARFASHLNGASHGFDVAFLFSSSTLLEPFAKAVNISWTPEDKAVVNVLVDSIHRFMLTG